MSGANFDAAAAVRRQWPCDKFVRSSIVRFTGQFAMANSLQYDYPCTFNIGQMFANVFNVHPEHERLIMRRFAFCD